MRPAPRTMTIVAVAIGSALIGGAAIATTGNDSGTQHGCVSGGASSDDPNPAGTLSITDSSGKCPSGDKAITFNEPAALPVTAMVQAHKKLPLKGRKPLKVLSTKLVIGKGYQMWTQGTLDVKTGSHATTITVRMLLNGKRDEAPITTTIPAHSSQDIAPLFLCDASIPVGANTVGIELTSSASGASIGTRSLLVQAAAD